MCCHPLGVARWIRLKTLCQRLHRAAASGVTPFVPWVTFEQSPGVHDGHLVPRAEPLIPLAMMFVMQGRFNSVLLRTGRNGIDIAEIRRRKTEPSSRSPLWSAIRFCLCLKAPPCLPTPAPPSQSTPPTPSCRSGRSAWRGPRCTLVCFAPTTPIRSVLRRASAADHTGRHRP